MIAYTTLGTNDLPKAAAFYDALLSGLGAKRTIEMDRIIIYGVAPGAPMFAVCTPFDGKEATAGNGTMVALAVDKKEAVDALYQKALQLGATDEGAPGLRGFFYIGYVRDLDGNKLNFFYGGA
jgi:predicted lactoylglutathione lyase